MQLRICSIISDYQTSKIFYHLPKVICPLVSSSGWWTLLNVPITLGIYMPATALQRYLNFHLINIESSKGDQNFHISPIKCISSRDKSEYCIKRSCHEILPSYLYSHMQNNCYKSHFCHLENYCSGITS